MMYLVSHLCALLDIVLLLSFQYNDNINCIILFLSFTFIGDMRELTSMAARSLEVALEDNSYDENKPYIGEGTTLRM